MPVFDVSNGRAALSGSFINVRAPNFLQPRTSLSSCRRRPLFHISSCFLKSSIGCFFFSLLLWSTICGLGHLLYFLSYDQNPIDVRSRSYRRTIKLLSRTICGLEHLSSFRRPVVRSHDRIMLRTKFCTIGFFSSLLWSTILMYLRPSFLPLYSCTIMRWCNKSSNVLLIFQPMLITKNCGLNGQQKVRMLCPALSHCCTMVPRKESRCP